MTKTWITTPRDRETKKYKALHARLRAELAPNPPAKAETKRERSEHFRRTGELT